MTKAQENFARDALLQYSKEYLLKKGKSKQERAILEDESPRYVIYARRSTEDDKRQVQSKENQIDLCSKYAKDNGLVVVDIIPEDKSAKNPGKRDKFNMMLETIKEGNSYDSILAWHPDRLARNMKEAGEIMDLLDSGKIKDLKFVSYSFTNDAAGKMTLSILFAMAKEFSDKLSVDTKRGITKKVEKGMYCGSGKRGYAINSSGYFMPDDEKFEIYQDVWRLASEGKSLNEIKKKYPDEKISYEYLKDPFSAGMYCYGNQIIDLSEVHNKFKPLVSPEDFLSVQRMFHTRGGWILSKEFFPFRTFIKCGYCGNYMTPARSRSKSQVRYLYLTCANEKCIRELTQKGGKSKSNRIRANMIVDYIVEFLESHKDVSRELYQKAVEKDKGKLVEEKIDIQKLINKQKKEIQNLAKKERFYSNKIISDENTDGVAKSISGIIDQRRGREEELYKLELTLSEIEAKFALETPDYESFLNFFKKLIPAIQKTDNPQLIDNIVKMVFLNISVAGKKVLKHELNEPYKTFWEIKNRSGVEDGARTHNPRFHKPML